MNLLLLCRRGGFLRGGLLYYYLRLNSLRINTTKIWYQINTSHMRRSTFNLGKLWDSGTYVSWVNFIILSILYQLTFYLQLFVGVLMSYLGYMCLFAYIGVQYILCCVFVLFFFVLCSLCCWFLCIVNFLLPLRYSLTFIY